MSEQTIRVFGVDYAFDVPDDGSRHHVSAGFCGGVFSVEVDGVLVPVTFRPAPTSEPTP